MPSNSIRHVAHIPLIRNVEGKSAGKINPMTVIVGYAMADDIDARYLGQFRWRLSFDKRTRYAFRSTTALGKTYRHQMHTIVWWRHYGEVPDGLTVDHIDHDGLNNQIANLRLATQSQQIRNQKRHRGNTSGYRGVTWDTANQEYRASIRDGELFYLGRYATAEEAAVAYNYVAVKISGEFAFPNPLPPGAVSDARIAEIIADMEERYIPRIGQTQREVVEWVHTVRPDGTSSNHRVRRDSKTGYRGVSKAKASDTYRSTIRYKGRLIFLGDYKVKEEAAIAYNHASPIFYGNQAKLNVIPDSIVGESRRDEVIALVKTRYLPRAEVALSKADDAPVMMRADGTKSKQRLQVNSTTGYQGVAKEDKARAYRAHLRHQGKTIYLGNYDTAEEAAIAFNHASPLILGSRAVLNVIPAGTVTEPRRAEIIALVESRYLPRAGVATSPSEGCTSDVYPSPPMPLFWGHGRG